MDISYKSMTDDELCQLIREAMSNVYDRLRNNGWSETVLISGVIYGRTSFDVSLILAEQSIATGDNGLKVSEVYTI